MVHRRAMLAATSARAWALARLASRAHNGGSHIAVFALTQSSGVGTSIMVTTPGDDRRGQQFELSVQLGMLRLDGLDEIADSPDSQHLLDLLGAEPGTTTLEGVRARATTLAEYDQQLNAVPREDLILKRIVWPLRAAKQSLLLGSHLGCIALCGTIAEMLAILRFEVSAHGKLSQGAQERLYGSSFARLGQSRRINILSELNLYAPEQVGLYRDIMRIRNIYLHALDVPAGNIEADAMAIYRATVQVVDAMVAVRGSSPPGTVAPGAHLVEFLRERGAYRMTEGPGSSDQEEAERKPEPLGGDSPIDMVPEIKETTMQFRGDWAEHRWDVAGVREQVGLLDHPFIKVSYTGKYGLPIRGPSPTALRKALELIEAGEIGQTIVSRDLVITVEGLGDRGQVSMLEGPGAGDPQENPKLTAQ